MFKGSPPSIVPPTVHLAWSLRQSSSVSKWIAGAKRGPERDRTVPHEDIPHCYKLMRCPGKAMSLFTAFWIP